MTRASTYKRRLLKLAAFLEKLPPNRFNFATWVGCHWNGAADLSCGTTACALGWATTIPEFQRLGLRMRKVRGLPPFPCIKRSNYYGINAAHHAANKLFDLEMHESQSLFVPGYGLNSDATAKQVAKHIRKFVKEKYS
jgi:hypothetical protein